MVDRSSAHQCRSHRQSSPRCVCLRVYLDKSRRCRCCCKSMLPSATRYLLIVSASRCGIPYRFPSLVQKHIRNVGIKDHGRIPRSHCHHLVRCTDVSHPPFGPAPKRPRPLNGSSFYASQLLSVSFGAMFGRSWIDLENSLPLSAKVSTKIMICYFIMWLIQVPFAFIQSVLLASHIGDRRLIRSPSAAKHIFTVKSIFLPVSAFAFIGGLVHLAGGSLDLTIVNPVVPASNAAFSWAFLQGLNAIFGVSSPLVTDGGR